MDSWLVINAEPAGTWAWFR